VPRHLVLFDRLRCRDGRFHVVPHQPLWLSVQPIIDIFTHLVLGHAVALRILPSQLVAAAVDLSEIVIGQLTPFLLDLVFRGFPVPFNLIPIHSLTSKPALLRAQTT